MVYDNGSKKAIEERQFLHDLAGKVAASSLYLDLIKESGDLIHLSGLVETHQEIEKLIQERRTMIKSHA